MIGVAAQSVGGRFGRPLLFSAVVMAAVVIGSAAGEEETPARAAPPAALDREVDALGRELDALDRELDVAMAEIDRGGALECDVRHPRLDAASAALAAATTDAERARLVTLVATLERRGGCW